MGKMITQATKVKKVLSTNSEIPVTLNSLHDDIDLSSTVTRAAFEDASKDLLKRVNGPIDRALEQAGMTLNDIAEVELIGGGVRIPKVWDTLWGAVSLKAVRGVGGGRANAINTSKRVCMCRINHFVFCTSCLYVYYLVPYCCSGKMVLQEESV